MKHIMKVWLKSARFAIRGMTVSIREERNIRIQYCALVLVCVVSFIIRLSLVEFSIVIICCALVLCFEYVNSALERFLYISKPRISLQLAAIKDLLSASVFIASFASFIIACLLIVPTLVTRIVYTLHSWRLF